MREVQPQLPELKVKLDWKAYYLKFSEMHGGWPIIYKGRQLFSDGWTYSLTDYAGPEWEPPTEPKELKTLRTVYWYTRLNRAKNELLVVAARRAALKNLQENKSAPLQQVIVSKDDETGKVSRSTDGLDLRVFDHVISFLEAEVNEASKNLEQLKESSNDEASD